MIEPASLRAATRGRRIEPDPDAKTLRPCSTAPSGETSNRSGRPSSAIHTPLMPPLPCLAEQQRHVGSVSIVRDELHGVDVPLVEPAEGQAASADGDENIHETRRVGSVRAQRGAAHRHRERSQEKSRPVQISDVRIREGAVTVEIGGAQGRGCADA